jgi:hypothetical protein
LGGGSNILFTKDYDGAILKNEIKGIELQHEDADHVYVKVGAGENWHQFVLHCIHHNWAGVENLSLIPGNIGASPIQNIGLTELSWMMYSGAWKLFTFRKRRSTHLLQLIASLVIATVFSRTGIKMSSQFYQ